MSGNGFGIYDDLHSVADNHYLSMDKRCQTRGTYHRDARTALHEFGQDTISLDISRVNTNFKNTRDFNRSCDRNGFSFSRMSKREKLNDD